MSVIRGLKRDLLTEAELAGYLRKQWWLVKSQGEKVINHKIFQLKSIKPSRVATATAWGLLVASSFSIMLYTW